MKLKKSIALVTGASSGNDVAGVVVRVGSRVRRFKPGREIYARPDKDRIGTFAEFIALNEDAVAINPTHSLWKKRPPSLWWA